MPLTPTDGVIFGMTFIAKHCASPRCGAHHVTTKHDKSSTLETDYAIHPTPEGAGFLAKNI